ncbi:rhombotarget A [Acinetobacter colistiniresistens]|uniref:Rhombotarget A n=1 Tax=Acinetobacter colistiniresistens TaxID=280145 RepID=S3TA27_9GAMM|nr:rhombotarget A [Acinetobacter colistiniresistens]EPG38386.1 rhombotarget A [Acinetobacter colistiniresistens]TVT83890.1 rhombotarget A [Acinetobacter colistiniresistens]
MLKRMLACALFTVTGYAYSADIQVTTLVDEDKDDAVCSLREAVEFLNKRSQKEFENGYHGCGNKDASSTIILQRDQTYQLNSALNIKAAMTIRTAVSDGFNDNKKGLNNATLKMAGTDRLFVIDDNNVESALLLVGLIELNLQGSSNKVNDGGLILNRENLSIQYSRLTGGAANRGGAIYNAGVASDAKNTAGYVSINNSILQNNKADQGAVIYSEMPMYLITQSVIRDNEGAAGPNGALLFVQTGFNNDTIAGALTGRSSGIRSSTIFHNKGGYVANIREGMILNNNTIIKNAAGLYLQSLNRKVTTTTNGETKVEEFPSAYVSNSILVANGNTNCVNTSDDTTIVQSNLTTSDCDRNAEKRLPNFMWNQNDPEQALIAGGTNDEGICAAPPAKGLLCPYSTPKDQMLGFFKPRLLTSYKLLSDSLIVNKGRIYSDGTTFSLASCEATDQRGKSRTGFNELCDLGAIELVVNRGEIPIVGQDILYGQIAKFSIAESLLDGELLDPATCEAQLGKRSDGQPWQVGCLQVIQTQTSSKGKVTLDQDGNVTYVPDSDWHGADKFNLRVMTTTTRFNDVSNYFIDIPTTIVQDPPNNFKSKTVNVGSFGLGAILALFGLIGLRRLKS